jgi:chromate transport protein ChrA
MDIILKFVAPIVIVLVGIVCLLVGKKNDSKTPQMVGLIALLAGIVWFIIGTF